MARGGGFRWTFPLVAGLALIGSSVACGAGEFRLRSAGAEPLDRVATATGQAATTAPPALEPTLEPAPTASPTIAPSPTPIPRRMALIQVKALRVRAGAGTGFPVIAGVKMGQQLETLGQNADGSWLNVRTGDREGWIAAEFAKVVEVAPESAALPVTVPGAEATISGSRGLDVRRKDVQDFYEELGFSFSTGTAPDGREVAVGTNHTRQATVTLTGPENNLTAASITAVTRYDQETMVLSAAYLTGFASRVLPRWADGPAWIQAHIGAAKAGVPAEIRAGDVTVTLRGNESQLTLELISR